MTAEPVSDQDATPHAALPVLDALSVVIPVYNQEAWIRTCLEALLAAGVAAGLALDVVVVDDGSTDGTPAVLAELAARTGIRVLTQPNAGRFVARTTGVAAAAGPWIMLLDSRVVTHPQALHQVRAHIAQQPDRRVWNGHVDVETRGNMFSAFWSALPKIGWRRYTANPRLVSFGPAEFDYYPKGTTALLLPRELFIEALGGFESLYDNSKLSSDDTRLLRNVVARERIWISPDFAFTYHGHSGLRGFRRQAYLRGTTFVDAYLGQSGVIRRVLIAAIVAAALVVGLAIVAPWVALGCVVAALVGLPIVVRLVGGTWPEVRVVAILTPLFAVFFGAGVLRGLFLAATRAIRVRIAPAR